MIFRSILILLGIVYGISAQAILVEHSIINIVENKYQADYTITNSDVVEGVEELSIYYDYLSYSDITVESTPNGWDPLTIQPDPSIPDNGFVDILSFSTPLALGDVLSGLSVSFFHTEETSFSSYFEVLNPFTFEVISSGPTTELVDNSSSSESEPSSVTEPSSLLMLISSLLIFGISKSRRLKAL